MTINQLIAELEILKEKHGGEIDVAVWQYAGGDDRLCDVSPRFDERERQVILDTTYQG